MIKGILGAEEKTKIIRLKDYFWCHTNPTGDIPRLVEIYNRLPHQLSLGDSKKFVNGMGFRVYTEWCMGEAKDNWRSHSEYRGEAFKRFLDDETIYATERAIKKSLLNREDSVAHSQIRCCVLEASVKRAMELFNDWKALSPKSMWPQPSEDVRNLRTSLEPYLGF